MSSGGVRRVGLGSAPPSLLVLLGILSVQIGAGFAKNLFGTLPPSALVVLRLATSAVVVGVMARKGLRGLRENHSRTDLAWAAALGLSLALMNFSIYQSIQQIPLGVAVTIEFLGPLLVAVVSSRRALDLVWAALALLGVLLLARGGGDVTVQGVLWAMLAGAGWAAYIVASAATGKRIPGTTGLALASIVGTFAVLPLGVGAVAADGGWSVLTPHVLMIGVLVGLLSSVVPYTLELEALRRIPPRVFGILMALEPAVAALVGVVLLGEVLSALQWLAICAVIAACLGATRTTKA
ncbi:EamA family transporter [Actinocorallia longicatena]|uniref:EamA family transporter n=1 Tax=Actinocorallia longicatena TaxID=111803 RepID=UPI0031DD2CEA